MSALAMEDTYDDNLFQDPCWLTFWNGPSCANLLRHLVRSFAAYRHTAQPLRLLEDAVNTLSAGTYEQRMILVASIPHIVRLSAKLHHQGLSALCDRLLDVVH